ncbi:DMT family transporter [Labedella endophytica]|uniref:DMT family transporter n=1 Tax=Labedella endophytica TaxID=1523160 RepID=A0A3S0XXF9_9MICO|nr:DMT family transporter [Labedella endophytica]RUQ98071.1 DMT family transporter [Labedella endophytica]
MSKQIGIHRVLLTATAGAGFILAWSSGFVIPAMMPTEVHWITLLVWRFVPLAVLLVAIAIATGRARGVTRNEVRGQALIGLFAQTGYCVFVYAAIGSGVAVGTTALVDAIQPLLVATLVGPLLGLRVRGAQWAGLIVGAGGVALVVSTHLGSSTAPLAAYGLPALAMACLVAGTFLQRRSESTTPVIVVLTIHVTVTAIVCLVLAVVTGTLVPPTTASFWLSALLAAVFPTLAAYGLYWWLLRRIGITALNALLFLIAPATAIAGWALLGEPMTVITLAGFALCGAGVAAVLVSEARSATPDAGQGASSPEATVSAG